MKCGVGDYTAKLANALHGCDDTAVAVVTHAAAVPKPAAFQFEVFPVARTWGISDLIPISSIVRPWRPDIMHIQYPTQGYGHGLLPWFLPTLFSIANVPIVQTWHEYHPERVRRNILNAVLGGGLVVVRPDYKAMMPGWYRWLIRNKSFRFIPNASAIPQVELTEEQRLKLRSRFAPRTKEVVVFFGFVHPAKRVELLFEIADPKRHHLILIGDLNVDDAYHNGILRLASEGRWAGHVTMTGFLSPEEVGQILAASDAVVLPFRDGAGIWNTSIHAALSQGTFVLATSQEGCGYNSSENIYFARPDDVADMSCALRTYIGTKKAQEIRDPASNWRSIADSHRSLFQQLITGNRQNGRN